jgi:hypothetical protein
MKYTFGGGLEKSIQGDHHTLGTLKTITLDLGKLLAHEVIKDLGLCQELKDALLIVWGNWRLLI